MTYGEELKERLDKLRITQAELAKGIGVSVMTIRRYANDKAVPRKNRIDAIDAYLKQSIDTYQIENHVSEPKAECDVSEPKAEYVEAALYANNLQFIRLGAIEKESVNRLMELCTDFGVKVIIGPEGEDLIGGD